SEPDSTYRDCIAAGESATEGAGRLLRWHRNARRPRSLAIYLIAVPPQGAAPLPGSGPFCPACLRKERNEHDNMDSGNRGRVRDALSCFVDEWQAAWLDGRRLGIQFSVTRRNPGASAVVYLGCIGQDFSRAAS